MMDMQKATSKSAAVVRDGLYAMTGAQLDEHA
jgi:hypothetical protein